MSAPEVNMARAELWATVTMGEDGMSLADATIDGRPLTEEERAELGAAVLADLQAACVLRQAHIAGIDVYVATTKKLMELLAPWWSDKSTPLGEVLATCPPIVQAEAIVLLDVMNATAGQ